MPIKYQRDPPKGSVHYPDLRPGRFYRLAADSSIAEPPIYLATDDNTVVRLGGGIQLSRYLYEEYVEVHVEITIGGDV
jgi:hypothetical protein